MANCNVPRGAILSPKFCVDELTAPTSDSTPGAPLEPPLLVCETLPWHAQLAIDRQVTSVPELSSCGRRSRSAIGRAEESCATVGSPPCGPHSWPRQATSRNCPGSC